MSSLLKYLSARAPAIVGGLGGVLLLSMSAVAVAQTLPQSLTDTPILVNEILAHADNPYVDSVELYNPGDSAVDISGWLMTDKEDRPQTEWVRVPAGTQIGANGFHVIANTKQDEWPFGFSEGGDSIFLYRPDPQGGAPIEVASVEFGASPVSISFVRHVDSIGRLHYPFQQGSPTLGAPNCPLRVGPVIIEEIMPDPQASGGEYVVIANISNSPATLFDPEAPVNTWKFIGQNSRGTDNDMLIFPIGVTLAPGERVILSEMEPDAFRAAFDIPDAVRIFGPLASGLSKEGERVALAMPLPPETDGMVYFAVVDEVAYRGQAPWPNVAENGRAMGRVAVDQFANDPINWQAVTPFGTLLVYSQQKDSLSSTSAELNHRSYLPVISLPPYGCW